MDYLLSIFTFAAIWAIVVLSLNILVGYGGQVSLGHAALFGIGAYSAALLTTRYELPFLLMVPAAMAITALAAAILGLPSLRVSHDFLVLATIGLNFVVIGVFSYVDFFGGGLGIVGIPLPEIGGYELRGGIFLALCVGCAALAAWLSWALPRSWGGLGLLALREDQVAATSVGVSHARYKITAFALSGAVAGLGGALYAPFVGNVFPDRFGFLESVGLMAMLVFGGIGTVRGAVFGGVVLKALPEYLRFGGQYRFALFGAILVLVILLQPQGLLGEGSFLWLWIQRAWKKVTDVLGLARRPRRPARERGGEEKEAPPETAVLAVKNLTVDFDGLRALDRVSVSVRTGEVLGLIGPNGAGKTTLFNAVAGLIPITDGAVALDGRSLRKVPAHDIPRRGIGRTFQVVRPFGSLTVDRNVLAGFGVGTYPRVRAFLSRHSRRARRATELAEQVGVRDRHETPARNLPIGLLRRLEVGRALAMDPAFVLLDEPAAGLSHEEVDELAGLVAKVASRGKGVILVEHNMRFAMQVCDRMVVLASGKVLAEGTPDEVRGNPEVMEAYLGKPA